MRENLGELPALVDLAARIGVPEVYVQRLVFFEQGLAAGEQSLYRRLRDEEEALLAAATERAAALGILFRASGLGTPQESLAGGPGGERPWAGCHRPWTTTYITANGNVLPCCISPFSTRDYAALVLGNVWETPFAEIWGGARYARAPGRPGHPTRPCTRASCAGGVGVCKVIDLGGLQKTTKVCKPLASPSETRYTD